MPSAVSSAVTPPLHANTKQIDVTLLSSICEALAIIIGALGDYARSCDARERVLWLAVRQGGLIIVGALERHIGRSRSFVPKHQQQR